MLRTRLDDLLTEALRDRRLLDHAFYRRWEAGMLAPGELGAYAGQYRHFEATLPTVLETVVDALPEGSPRRLIEANLADERGVPAPHLELFDAFAAGVGAPTCGPAPQTAALVALYHDFARSSAVAALAALAAYEVQAPSVSASKAEGLRTHYGLDPDATRFWDVHAGMDEQHGQWTLDAVASLATDAAEVSGAARAAADAWWAFLDEREAEAFLVAPA